MAEFGYNYNTSEFFLQGFSFFIRNFPREKIVGML